MSMVFLLLGLVTLVMPQTDLGPLFFGLSGAAFVWTLVDNFLKLYNDGEKVSGTHDRLRTGGPLLRPYAKPYDTWLIIKAGDDEAVHHPALDADLEHARIRLNIDDRLWLPKGEHETLRRLKVSTLDRDEHKVRLQSDLLPGTTEVDVRRTPYSAFLVTNRLASYAYRKRGSRREYVSFAEVGVDADGLLSRLSRSKCSNHIGVDVLAISDGQLLLQRQAKHNRLNADKILGSGSGAADWDDLAAADADLLDFVRYNMRREMAEELGLQKAELPPLSDIKVLGYARLTSLAGKPQFYGLARLAPVQARIQWNETLYVDEHYDQEFDPDDGVDGLRRALDRIEAEFRGELAFPLYVNIHMIRQWLDNDPTAADWIRSAAGLSL